MESLEGIMRVKRNTQTPSQLEKGSEGKCESAQMDLGAGF